MLNLRIEARLITPYDLLFYFVTINRLKGDPMLFYTINSKESGCANIGAFGSCIRIGAFAGIDSE